MIDGRYRIVLALGLRTAPDATALVDLAAVPDGVTHRVQWGAAFNGVTSASQIVVGVTVPYQASTLVTAPIQRPAVSAVSPSFRICIPTEPALFADGFVHGSASSWSEVRQ